MTLKHAVGVALSMELVETEASKTKGLDIVCTQWFRDGKANGDRIVRMPSVKVVKVRSCKQDVCKKAIKVPTENHGLWNNRRIHLRNELQTSEFGV